MDTAAGSGVCAGEYGNKAADTGDCGVKNAAAHAKRPQMQVGVSPVDAVGAWIPN
jgi:hypothetical protein